MSVAFLGILIVRFGALIEIMASQASWSWAISWSVTARPRMASLKMRKKQP